MGLVSGGYIDMGQRRADKRERRLDRRERRFERRHGSSSQHLDSSAYQQADYLNHGYSTAQYPRDQRAMRRNSGAKGPIGVIKKVMQEDVLYLMIVPMPSEEELAEARQLLAADKEGK